MCGHGFSDVPLPSGWAKNVKAAVLHVISLAHFAIVAACGWVANSINARVRLSSENDRLQQEMELLREELRIKDARIAKIEPRRRPRYPATERMAILELKAARGWSLAQAARAFLVEAQTIAAWFKRLDEDGSSALVQLREPVNRFPDFVRYIVQQLKVLCPSLGKVKTAQVLARAGLHLCATTAGRMLKAKTPPHMPTEAPAAQATTNAPARVVTAKRPNHVWHVGPDDRAHRIGFLDSLAALLSAPVLAVLLVGRLHRGSLLAEGHGHRRLPETAGQQAGQCLSCQDDPQHHRQAQVRHLRQGIAVLVQGVQTLVPATQDQAEVWGRWPVRQHRRHRAAHPDAQGRRPAPTSCSVEPSGDASTHQCNHLLVQHLPPAHSSGGPDTR